MQTVFLKEVAELGRSSGFRQRKSRITPEAWVRGLVFGWLSDPQVRVCGLARSMALAGADVSPQAVQRRFSAAGVRLLSDVLGRLMAHSLGESMLQSVPKGRSLRWMEAFPRILIRDSTVISLPLALREKWRGTGGFTGPSAGLKISAQWEWHSGQLLPLHLSHASLHDQTAAECQDQAIQKQGHRVQPGEMHLFDLGYFKLQWLKQLTAQEAYFCCRYKNRTDVIRAVGPDGKRMAANLVDWLAELPIDQTHLEMSVWLGKKVRVPCRLLAVRVPEDVKLVRQETLKARSERKGQKVSSDRLELCGWTVLVTNAPDDKLSFDQTFELYRLRWQIERLFRLWKETLKMDEWRTTKPLRIECEIYAKLIGALLTQRLTAFGAWSDPMRSLAKCADIVAKYALALLHELSQGRPLKSILQAIQTACGKGARIDTKGKRPSSPQRLQRAQRALS
jgi:hypothetical protein